MIRLSKRLEQLEQAATPGLSVDADRLLVGLMGRLDALWWPFREHEGSYRAEVRRLQLEYLNGRGGLRSRSQGESSWKSAHYARNELIASKLVDPQIEGGQVTSMRLTAQGLADAMAMIGDRLHAMDSMPVKVMHELLRRQAGQWVRENIFGEDVCIGDNPSAWDYAIEWMLPLLRCGAVESNSDTWNRVYFWFNEDVTLPVEPPSTRTIEAWADPLYVASFNAERDQLQRLESEDGSIFIPHRCS